VNTSFLCLLLGIALGGKPAGAAVAGPEKSSGEKTIILPAGEVHQGWYFAAGDRVVINGTINGDAYVAGGIVEINGTINGDLLAAGGDVEVGGSVTDDVRAAGGTVHLRGRVGKNVTVAGGTVALSGTAAVEGGFLAAGGTMEIAGSVAKDVIAVGQLAEVTGRVGGNARLAAGQVHIYRGASIEGSVDIEVRSKNDVTIDPGAVKGITSIRESERHGEGSLFSTFRFWFKLIWIVGLLLSGLLFFLIARNHFRGYGLALRHEPLMSLLWGVIAVIVTPFFCLILILTLVGMPIGLVLLAAYLTLLYLSQLSLGLLAGDLLLKTEAKTGWSVYWAFAVGLVIFQLLTLIPVFGIVLELGAMFLGAGALIVVTKKSLIHAPASTVVA
jgi:cytoskeletal protein CcmA (bactofilin family)